MPLDWLIRTCFVRNQCRPLQRSPPRFSIWRYPHAILRRIEKLQRRPASYGLVSPISTKHLASSTLPASGGLNGFFLFESTCLCLLSLSRLYGYGACSVKMVLFFFFFHFPFYFSKFLMALPYLKLARRPRWRRPISTRLHMQQTRDVAVLFTRGWSALCLCFRHFIWTSSWRAIWQDTVKARHSVASCLGSTALSHVAFVLGDDLERGYYVSSTESRACSFP
ncbi:hypothetical protein J3E68DRAFT_340460 [Trichoderma sp. SZMC 28012]